MNHWLLPVAGKTYTWRLPTPAQLSATPMAEMAQCIGPAFVYTLRVHPGMLLEARWVLQRLACTVRDNPFAPYVNLEAGGELERREWTLEANGIRCGTEGC
jgi:hypothetical protein